MTADEEKSIVAFVERYGIVAVTNAIQKLRKRRIEEKRNGNERKQSTAKR